MNKTIAILGIVGAFVIGTLLSVDIATAVKPTTETTETIQKTIDLQPVAGRNLEVNVVDSGTSLLFYGEQLCQLLLQNDPRLNTVYIEFATTTTVLDQGACGQPSASINLVGAQDAVFQPGDFLILQGINEVYRQQTP